MYKFTGLRNAGITLVLFLLFASACKKDKKSDDDDVKTPVDNAPATGSRDELNRDSVFLYARQVYLWWTDIPGYSVFAPRNYSSLDAELFALTRYAVNPATSRPYEFLANSRGVDTGTPKYSYVTNAGTQSPVGVMPERKSSVDLDGNGDDFGFKPGLYWLNEAKTVYGLYIQAVNENSPAEEAGHKRGDLITKINGRTIGSNYDAEIDFINDVIFGSQNIKIEGTHTDGTSFNTTLTASYYATSPIYKDVILTADSKKIGYLAYARFSSPANSNAELDEVFSRFAAQGVTDLIIDLRYNGGGYVTTAEHLINLIAPSSLNGQVMYVEHFNKLMQQDKATILQKQPLLDANGQLRYQNGKLLTYADVNYSVSANTNNFTKAGSLNGVKNVVFIVTSGTASASELVINSLKPYLTVKIVGATSYGKPVGFAPIRIGQYDVYYSMFESKNKNGEGGYYSGMTPDTGTSTADDDDPKYDFGDVRERSMAAAYNYLTRGTFVSSVSTNKISAAADVRTKVVSVNGKSLDDKEFKGMIETPSRLKLKK